MDQEVYHSKEFAEYASKNLVLVQADFPNKPISAELKKANEGLRQKYATPFQGFPTTVILDSNGKKLGEKIGYPPGSGPKAFIKEIGQIAKK